MQKNVCPSEPGRGAALACFLRSHGTEHHVFQAVVLSIVLTLAVGPNVSLLCRTWCDQQVAAASRCHHEDQGTSPSVAGNDCCDSDNGMLTAEFLPKDVQSGVSPDGVHAIPLLRHEFAHSATHASPGDEPGREWSLEKSPLPTVLRI